MSDFNIQFEEQDQSITLEFEQIGGGAVKSVNGKTGVVVLDAGDLEYDDTETYSSGSVGDELSTLKDGSTRLDDLSFGINNHEMPVIWFEYGSLNNGADDPYLLKKTARLKKIMRFDTDVYISANKGYFHVAYFNSSDVYTSNSGWKDKNTSGVYIKAGTGFRLMVRVENSASGADRTIPELVECLNFINDNAVRNTVSVGDFVFEHGSLNRGANDDGWHVQSRIRTKDVIELPYSVLVSMATGVYLVSLFNDDGTWRIDTAWRTTQEFLIPAYTKFRLMLSLDQVNDNYAPIDSILDSVSIVYDNISNFSAVPNVVYQCRNVNDAVYPPYTKYYIQASAANEYDRVRFNVRKSTDGVFFLCHDTTINSEARNPDGSEITTSITASSLSISGLNAYDWGIKYGEKYAGLGVPLLSDALFYSSMFNLGVTLEISYIPSTEDVASICAMCAKYGLLDKLIIIDITYTDFATLKKFTSYNPRISVFVGAEESWWTAEHIAQVKELQTEFNSVYIQLHPWGTWSTENIINIAGANNFKLYNSIIMDEWDFKQNKTFTGGYNLLECNNIPMIKQFARDWANKVVIG